MTASFLQRIPTRIKRWLAIFCIVAFSASVSAQATLYTYQSGAWDNIDVWTTDPGGTTLVGSKIPGNGDAVVVLPSRTLTLPGNIVTTGLSLTVQAGSTFDASSFTFSSPLANLGGQGTYRLSSANFPLAVANTLTAAGGGTVEFYNGANFNLPAAQTSYFNLNINCAGFTATQLSDITIIGNLKVLSGTYRINDDIAARRTLVVNGDVEVGPGAFLTVGKGNTTTTTDPLSTGVGGIAPFLDYYVVQAHRIEIFGNLTNNGTVRFTNQDYPIFNAFPTDGIASVFFRGAADKTITCNGTTDFYNLVVDKGNDQTFILSVNSTAYDRFRIFGANTAGEFDDPDESNPNIRKALWIRNGTLRLNGYTFIPSLSEGGGDFFIPGNGALVLGGPDVVVMGTIDDYSVVNLTYSVNGGTGSVNGITKDPADAASSLSLYGKLQVNEGRLYIGEAGRIIYHGTAAAQFIINGGTIDIKQFQSVTGGGKTAYWQTGGNLILRGRFKRSLQYTSLADLIASIGDPSRLDTERSMSPSGTDPDVGTLNIDQDANIFHMENGNIDIYDVTGSAGTPRAIEINSDPANISVTGGNVTIYLTSGTGPADAPYGIASKAPLYNLSLIRKSGEQGAVLDSIPAKAGVTRVAAPPLRVVNNLTLAANSSLNSSGFSVMVGGNFSIQANAVYNPGDNRTILNGNGNQNFTNSGIIASGTGLHRLIIDKNAGTATLGSNMTVRDSLVINSGTINDGGFILNVAGNVYNGGTHAGTGKLVFNGSARQYVYSEDGALFGNLVLKSTYNTAPYQALTFTSDISAASFTLAGNKGVVYLDDYRLSTSAIHLRDRSTIYSATKMFMTDGSHSAKGVNLHLSLTGTLNGDVDTIPVGVFHSATSTGWYSPEIINVNASLGTTTYTGAVNVTPVDAYHPCTTKPTEVIHFYWKTLCTGTITSLDPSLITFRFYNSNIQDPGNQYKHFYLEQGSSEWKMGANYNNPLSFKVGFMSGAFTAGKNSPFKAPEICKAVSTGDWNNSATWTPHIPNSYDYAVIGGSGGTNYIVTVNDNGATCAGVTIYANGIAGDAAKPTLIVNAGLTGINFTTVSGGGKFVLKGSSSINFPGGDFDFFCNNDTAIFEYNDNGAAGSNYTIPSTIKTYPSLHITSSRNDLTKTLPDADITVRKSLRLFSLFSGNKLSFNNSGNAHFLTVNGDLEFRDASTLEVPAASGIKTINIHGNINFRYGDTDHVNAINVVDGEGASHILNFYGENIFSGASNLNLRNTGLNRLDLYFRGAGSSAITYGTGSFRLNRLIIQKDVVADTVYFRNNFTLNEENNTDAAKSLTLTAGTLVLSDTSNGSTSAINLNLTSGGVSYFNLNSTSGLILRNGSKINISGDGLGSGIRLDGLLMAEDSEIGLADETGTDAGYIEYSGSGKASIVLTGSSVFKAAQVRRSLSLSTGLLNYTQSGTSSATIYGTGETVSSSRAKFEITGTGSSFNMGGTSTLSIMTGSGTTYGDLYLRPGSSVISGGTIIFGTEAAGQIYKVDASVSLNNLVLNAANEIRLMVNPLVLMGNLTLTDANSRFTSNNLDVTIAGNFINNGTYTAGTNTTIFNGSTQTIGGASDPLFNNLTINPTVKVSLSRSITACSALNIMSGILETGNHVVTAGGNITNNGTYTNDASGVSCLYLNGTAVQMISGGGSFGRIELDNVAEGARLCNNLTLSEDLKLTNGVFDINQYTLTLGAESDIIPAAFGVTRMIKSDGVYSNGGIIKYFNAGFTGNFVFPSGVSGKYTPATLTINATNAGWVRINVINSKHPATLLPFNVLGYYWEVQSAITGVDGSLTLQYVPSDVSGDESLYVAGRLVIPPGTGWSKAAAGSMTDNVNETAHTIFFNFPAGTTNLGGQYTAGYTSDLPNTIPVYTSNTILGDWDSPSSWLPLTPGTIPDGVIVVIRPGDVINTHGNKRFAFKTTINGTLVTGTSYGHNLGTVDGTGTLSLGLANLPAGDFSSFIGCDGGTLEYTGGSYTIIADRIDTVKNIIFKGTGTKTLPDKNLVICNTLEIDGPVLDNLYNRKLSVGGSFLLTSGGFLSGTGAGATVTFNGTGPQTLAGFRSANPLNNLEIKNSAGLTLNSAIMMKGNLIMTDGIINTSADSLLKMTGQTSTATAGSATSFVNGPMSKNQLGGIDFTFPIGKAGRYGKLGLLNPQSGVWEAEYYNEDYKDPSVAGILTMASTTEYWHIKSPADGKTATVRLRWDSQSDINPMTTSGGINDIRVAEFDGTDWREKSSAVPSGNNNDGTVQTSGNIPINNTGHPQYYTLGSVSAVKPGITLGIPSPVCRCAASGSLPYLAASGNPDEFAIDWNAAAEAEHFVDAAWTDLASNPVSLSIPSSAEPGVYTGSIQVRNSTMPANISVPYPFSIIILPDISWTGETNADWNNPDNWSCTYIPDLTMPVTIPDDALNMPVISAGWTGYVNNLTVNSGTSLTIAGTLLIAGTITSSGTITAATGGIELNGTTEQVIPAGLFAGNTIRNLTVNNAAGAVLQGPLGATGVVKLQSGDLASDGNLTLVSDAAGTALIDGSGSGNVTGNVTMQRFLSSRFGYKYFSSPFQNATVNGFVDEIDLSYWFPLIYTFDENRKYDTIFLDPFKGYAYPANPLVPMTGYAINFGAESTPLTVDLTGIVNNSSYSVTVTNHNNPYAYGRNLLGNPYPSPIDWDSETGWTKNNVDDAIYYFKARTDQWGGVYSSWVNGASSDDTASNIIPSMQGFMVHVTSLSPDDGTVAMNNNVRVTDMDQPFIKGFAKGAEKPLLRLSASLSSYKTNDPLVIYFDEKASGNFDSKLDALKYYNTDYLVPNFFSFGNDGSKLSINSLPLPEDRIPSVPLGYKTYISGEVVFRLMNIEGPYSFGRIDLYDAVTGESHDLSAGGEYRVNLPAGDYFDRFFLNFESVATGPRESEASYKPFTAYSSGGLVYTEINYLTGKEGTFTLYNLTGQAVYNKKVYDTGHYEFDPGLKNGLYIVNFVSGNMMVSQKIIIKK